MPSIRRCPTCKALFPTIDALNYHYNMTSHMPLAHNCEICKRAFKTLSALQSHIKSNRRRHSKTDGKKTPARAVVAQIDGGGWNEKKDGDDWVIEDDDPYIGKAHEYWLAENDANGWGSLGNISECDVQIDGGGPMVVDKWASVATDNIPKPLPSVSDPTLPSPASNSRDLQANYGPSPSKADEATARARAALQSRFQVLGVSKLEESIDLHIYHTGKAESPAPKLDGSCSIATKLSPNSTNKSKLPLNSLTNTTHLFTCPGCRKEFKLFSGFVLHIENRACKSSMCHEIEDRISTCATQIFDTFTS